jgi:hypothetical protein
MKVIARTGCGIDLGYCSPRTCRRRWQEHVAAVGPLRPFDLGRWR